MYRFSCLLKGTILCTVAGKKTHASVLTVRSPGSRGHRSVEEKPRSSAWPEVRGRRNRFNLSQAFIQEIDL